VEIKKSTPVLTFLVRLFIARLAPDVRDSGAVGAIFSLLILPSFLRTKHIKLRRGVQQCKIRRRIIIAQCERRSQAFFSAFSDSFLQIVVECWKCEKNSA
jgi:hypothetical protein